MPEIPTTKIGFIKEGVKYLLRLPLIGLTCLTGKQFLKPFSAWIVVTNKCNPNCLFCFVNKEVEVIDKLTKDIEYLIDMFFLAKEYGVKLNFMPLSYYRDNTYINRRYKKGAYGINFKMNGVVGFFGY